MDVDDVGYHLDLARTADSGHSVYDLLARPPLFGVGGKTRDPRSVRRRAGIRGQRQDTTSLREGRCGSPEDNLVHIHGWNLRSNQS
jgi:hypothetical protein